MDSTTVLVTLGGQAQVVTLALDALLASGETFDTVNVLHLAAEQPRVQRALAQLQQEFASGYYGARPVTWRAQSLHAGGAPLTAISSGRTAEAVWNQARDLLRALKQAGQRLHLCLAGGPRLLAMTLLSAAWLHCDHRDCLWHLYTPPEFLAQAREGAILHAPPEVAVQLIPVPFVPWGSYFPALHEMTQPRPAAVAPTETQPCTAVWAQLTLREREVLTVLAAGRLPQEAATDLGITLKTLDTHKTRILAECRVAWALPEGTRITYHFLRDKFAAWLDWRAQQPPSLASL